MRLVSAVEVLIEGDADGISTLRHPLIDRLGKVKQEVFYNKLKCDERCSNRVSHDCSILYYYKPDT